MHDIAISGLEGTLGNVDAKRSPVGLELVVRHVLNDASNLSLVENKMSEFDNIKQTHNRTNT